MCSNGNCELLLLVVNLVLLVRAVGGDEAFLQNLCDDDVYFAFPSFQNMIFVDQNWGEGCIYDFMNLKIVSTDRTEQIWQNWLIYNYHGLQEQHLKLGTHFFKSYEFEIHN